MKSNRRSFLRKSIASSVIVAGAASLESCKRVENFNQGGGNVPVVISTWQNFKANEEAWKILSSNGSALDAVERGAMEPEADPNDQSVGYGGRPDREGNVTLDACIMDHESDCGAVTYLQHIKHPIKVARKVMEETPHVMLSGAGALQFALEQGFPKENILTEKSKAEYQKWLETSTYKPVINIENHDTIGILALDADSKLAGACTTSGAAYKMAGRVGDSPLIGAGLFVDGDVGAATATGLGEAVIKVAGAHLVVELMRQGNSPMEACKLAVERVVSKNADYKELQVGFIAIDVLGNFGGYCIQPGFSYAVNIGDETQIFDAESFIKAKA